MNGLRKRIRKPFIHCLYFFYARKKLRVSGNPPLVWTGPECVSLEPSSSIFDYMNEKKKKLDRLNYRAQRKFFYPNVDKQRNWFYKQLQ